MNPFRTLFSKSVVLSRTPACRSCKVFQQTAGRFRIETSPYQQPSHPTACLGCCTTSGDTQCGFIHKSSALYIISAKTTHKNVNTSNILHCYREKWHGDRYPLINSTQCSLWISFNLQNWRKRNGVDLNAATPVRALSGNVSLREREGGLNISCTIQLQFISCKSDCLVSGAQQSHPTERCLDLNGLKIKLNRCIWKSLVCSRTS